MNRPKPRKILVLGDDGRSTLAIMRSLGRAGMEVDLAWSLPGDPPARSRYLSKLHPIPFPAPDGLWLEPLKAVLIAGQYDLVIPSGDRELIPLYLEQESLAPYARLAIPSPASFKATFDKNETTSLATRLGLNVPPWRLVSEGAGELPADVQVPCVLKPISSFDLARPSQLKHFVRQAFTREEADELLKIMSADGPVIAQEYFEGRGVGVELLAADGEVLFAFQHVRLHEPPQGGGSSYRRSESLDRELLAAAKSLTAALNYTGVMMVEFKRNDAGKWIFVEINARFWGSLPLALAAGADFPLYLVQMLLDGRTEFPQAYKVGVSSRNLFKDLAWQFRAAKVGRTNPHLIQVSRSQSTREIGRLLLGRDHFDLYTRDDPAPFWGTAAQLFRRASEELRSRLMPRRTRLGRARSVLFLCKGNICRSPFAAELLRARRPDLAVDSAGTYPASGRRSPEAAIAAAEGLGIDLSGHLSQSVSDDQLQKADVIVVFDPAQATWVKTHYPRHTAKLAYLGGVIPDPIGAPKPVFDACYRKIWRALDMAL